MLEDYKSLLPMRIVGLRVTWGGSRHRAKKAEGGLDVLPVNGQRRRGGLSDTLCDGCERPLTRCGVAA